MCEYRVEHPFLPEFGAQSYAQSCPARNDDPVYGLDGDGNLVVLNRLLISVINIGLEFSETNSDPRLRFVKVRQSPVCNSFLRINQAERSAQRQDEKNPQFVHGISGCNL